MISLERLKFNKHYRFIMVDSFWIQVSFVDSLGQPSFLAASFIFKSVFILAPFALLASLRNLDTWSARKRMVEYSILFNKPGHENVSYHLKKKPEERTHFLRIAPQRSAQSRTDGTSAVKPSGKRLFSWYSARMAFCTVYADSCGVWTFLPRLPSTHARITWAQNDWECGR